MVTLLSEIPAADPQCRTVESSLQDAFGGLAGNWTVRVWRDEPWATWWGFVEIDGPGAFHRSFVVEGPDEICDHVRADRALLQAVGRLEAHLATAAPALRGVAPGRVVLSHS
jgi:hypothetical protein